MGRMEVVGDLGDLGFLGGLRIMRGALSSFLFPLSSFLFPLSSFLIVIPSERSDEGSSAVKKRNKVDSSAARSE